MTLTQVLYLSCNVIFSQFNIFFLNLVDTELAVIENTPASQVEIKEEANDSTVTHPQDVHDQGILSIL